jgi:hypothetical protein
LGKRNSAGGFIDKVIVQNLSTIAKTKTDIKTAVQETQVRNARRRAIESTDERTVHFVFKPPHETMETPFTKKFYRFMTNELEAFEETENKAWADYLEDFRNEQIVFESGKVPIEFKPNNFFELELNALERIAFAVADNPFFRGDVAKYYPECHLIN